MHTRILAATLACLALPVLAAAQDAQLKLPSFADLKDKAVKSVDITIGSSLLGFMGWMMDDHDKDSAELKKTITGLKSVQIRSYKFTSDFAYSRARPSIAARSFARCPRPGDFIKSGGTCVTFIIHSSAT